MKKIILMCIFYKCYLAFSQIPLNDFSWVLKKQDDFNSFNSFNWHNTYSWGNINNGLEYNDPNNIMFGYQSGYLSIKAEKLTTPINYSGNAYYYKSGAIYSKFQYKYGYFEISAKLPIGKGFWPAFWLFGVGSNSSCPTVGYYNEIDIAENNGFESITGTTLGIHYHWRNFSTCIRDVNWWDPSITGLPDLSLEHKYAVLWEPDRMTWYFDDQPIRTIYDPVYTPQNAMSTILNFAIDGLGNPSNIPDISTPFPSYFQINYLKIYQLATDCNSPLSICTFNPATYTYKLQKSITVDGSGCNTNINTSENVSLRATDFVLLDAGTTITDNGPGTFSVIITPCTN